jgi:hypothetical protein
VDVVATAKTTAAADVAVEMIVAKIATAKQKKRRNRNTWQKKKLSHQL